MKTTPSLMQSQLEEEMSMNAKNSEQQETDFPRQIGNPATRALENAGYSHLEQLTQVTEKELLKLHGMGPKALGILKEALKAKGMSFAKPIKP
jgi:DNA-directed RNA polymerase alpha subunit